MKDLVFHVYRKRPRTQVIEHNLTVDQLEQRLISKEVDVSIHDIMPVYGEDYTDASF